jgi:hypothetical protein
MADDDLPPAADELYGLPLEEWTRARNDLAARLKKAHQSEQADAVRKLRKPSLVAWTVNQLARRDRLRMRALLQAGERLREAQRDALAGKDADVRGASDAQRTAVDALLEGARDVLRDAGRPPSDATLDRVALMKAAQGIGAQELAVARRIVKVASLPLLGSGKTDYVVLQRMAAERFAEQKAA